MACKRCGQCCTYVRLTLNLDPEGSYKKNIEDTIKWLGLHRVRGTCSGNEFEVFIPSYCSNLKITNGFAECKDYDNRPKECKDFLCDKAKE